MSEFTDTIWTSGNNKIVHFNSVLTDSIGEGKSTKLKFNVYKMTAGNINYVSVNMQGDSAQDKGEITVNANVIQTEQHKDTTKHVILSAGTINNTHFSFLKTVSGKNPASSNVHTFVINTDTLVLK